jgi:prophage antirepressor-like protein
MSIEENKITSEVGEKNFENVIHESKQPLGFSDSMGNSINERQPLEINRFFNELPIRILGTHAEPAFYLQDIAKVLNIRNCHNTIEHFGPREILSAQKRKELNIVTYRKYKNTFRRDDSMVLLTEAGLYRIMFVNRSHLAEQFRDWVYDVLHEIRTKGFYQVEAELQQLKTVNEQQQAEIGTLKQNLNELKIKQDKFKNLCEKLHMIEIANDIYKINQDIPNKFIKKTGERISKKFNEITNLYAYALTIDKELNLNTPFVETTPDMNLADLKIAHNQNTIIAKEVIERFAPKFTYLITDKITPELLTLGTNKHSIWVRNSKQSLIDLNKQLEIYKPMHIKSRYHLYTCDKQKIIDAMNAIDD